MNPAIGQAVETITTWLQLIVTVGAVVSLFYALSKFAQKPNQTQDQRLDELEKWKHYELAEWQKQIEQRLDDGNSHFESLDEGNRVTQKLLLALAEHALHGNNIGQLQTAINELNDYLTGGKK